MRFVKVPSGGNLQPPAGHKPRNRQIVLRLFVTPHYRNSFPLNWGSALASRIITGKAVLFLARRFAHKPEPKRSAASLCERQLMSMMVAPGRASDSRRRSRAVIGTVERVLGRKLIALDQWLTENAATFQ